MNKMSKKVSITYTPETRDKILSYFDMTVDEEGYIVDKDNQRGVKSDGKEVKAEDLIGIRCDGKFLIFLFEDNTFALIDLGDE